MLTYISFIIIALSIIALLSFIQKLRTRLFDKYFNIQLEESYNLNDLFPIKIIGSITPKVDYLEIPYDNLEININTKIIRGTIINNQINLELIKLSDRNKAALLIKQHYAKAVKSYINETIKNKKNFIELINISQKQRKHIKKIACSTCKHRTQCQIAFNGCNYKRETRDSILSKGLTINSNKNYEINNSLN